MAGLTRFSNKCIGVKSTINASELYWEEAENANTQINVQVKKAYLLWK